jgi:hypothetical protein
MKLSRSERQFHSLAEKILASGEAHRYEERQKVIERWHEGANHNNAAASAFFTPFDMAFHLALNVPSGGKLLDLCSGIGALTVGILNHGQTFDEIVLVEINPDYCDVARKLLPQAEVIQGSIYDPVLFEELKSRKFQTVVSNPPFGNVSKPQGASGPRYRGEVHYEIIDMASDMADYGVFILPQGACPFAYSGRQGFERVDNAKYDAFSKKTGIELELGVATDTTMLTRFRGTNITVEIVDADFLEARARRQPAQQELFLAA